MDRSATDTGPRADSTTVHDLIVNVSNVSRWFGEVQALTNLTIEVPSGSITVLLGPNGAGKTTAIRMITGALTPDEGSVTVFGIDPGSKQGEEVRRRCGVVSAKPSLYDRLSGWDNLRYAAELYGLGRGGLGRGGLGRGGGADQRIREAAAQFGIDQSLDQQVGAYSTGMKTRLALARSVLHDPELLLLDEPTSGLDPESALAVLELIREMTGQGRTVLMCTHLLLEAEGLADQVVIMQHGTSLVWGRPADLSRTYWPHPVVRISVQETTHLGLLADAPGVVDSRISVDSGVGATAELALESIDRVPALVARLVEAGAAVTAVRPFDPTLEDLYFAVRRSSGSSEDEIVPPVTATGRPTRARAPEMAR